MIELKYKFENLKICILENEDDFHFFFGNLSPHYINYFVIQ